MLKDLPEYFNAAIIMNTGIPIGVDGKELRSFRAIQKLLPFCLWRACVSLFATLLPVEIMFRRVMKFPDEVAKHTMPRFHPVSIKEG